MAWLECTEGRYPNDEVYDRVVVSYILCGERYYDFFRTCPYGWNTLCKIEGACFKILEEPEDENNIHSEC